MVALRTDLSKSLAPAIGHLATLKNSTVTISGAGFVGTWLTEAIDTLNAEFGFNTKVNLLSLTGNFIKTNASHLLQKENIRFTIQDCTRSSFDETTDFLAHCNSPLNPLLYQSHPILISSLISQGTRSFLDAASMLPRLRNILYLSSGTVYGPQVFESAGLKEDSFAASDCSQLSNVFAESKRFAESMCTAYRNEARLPIVIARPFAFLGPYQTSAIPWALHSFIDDALNGRPIRILGDGESVRSYMYGADAATWLLTLLASAQSGSIYNVGSPTPLTLNEIAQMVSRCFGNRIEITRLHQDAHLRKTKFLPSTSKIQESFNLKIQTETEVSLGKTIEWIQSTRGKK